MVLGAIQGVSASRRRASVGQEHTSSAHAHRSSRGTAIALHAALRHQSTNASNETVDKVAVLCGGGARRRWPAYALRADVRPAAARVCEDQPGVQVYNEPVRIKIREIKIKCEETKTGRARQRRKLPASHNCATLVPQCPPQLAGSRRLPAFPNPSPCTSQQNQQNATEQHKCSRRSLRSTRLGALMHGTLLEARARSAHMCAANAATAHDFKPSATVKRSCMHH